MSMAHQLVFTKPSLLHLSSPYSSQQARIVAPHRFIKISASACRNCHSVARAMQPSGADGGESSEEPKETNSAVAPVRSSGSSLPIPNIPIWARWVLGSIFFLAVPFYKRILRIEDGVEKTAETVVEAIEKVAEVAEKVASDVANALPDNKLRQEVLEVEHFAEVVDKGAEIAGGFLHKVDHVKEEVETLVEPIIEEGELIEKESQEKEKKENDSTPTLNL